MPSGQASSGRLRIAPGKFIFKNGHFQAIDSELTSDSICIGTSKQQTGCGLLVPKSMLANLEIYGIAGYGNAFAGAEK